MTPQGRMTSKPSAAARAEAAAWIARLHGPNRTQDTEDGLRRWLADAPEHASAFELVTDTWEKSARLRRRPMEQVASWERAGIRIRFSRAALSTAAIFALAVAATVFFLHSDAVTTGIGELRTVALEDGSRVHLNTNTRVLVHYDSRVRRVRLERGEALFEVAKRPDWPFIVTAGDRQIRALGTEFVVRRDARDLAVTLVEGRVTVSPVAAVQQSGGSTGSPAAPQSKSARPAKSQTFTLTPGERLTLGDARPARIDRPSLQRVIAWERGQVALDDTSLAAAVAEMNRYSHRRIVIVDPGIAAIRVSGIFQAGDSASFAQAVARLHHLKVLSAYDEIDLSRR
jgi:transmembrane sensor